nr:hypothetical protein [Pseudomonas sp. H1h]
MNNRVVLTMSIVSMGATAGRRIIWLPKRFGHFSIEILQEKTLQAFVEAAFI